MILRKRNGFAMNAFGSKMKMLLNKEKRREGKREGKKEKRERESVRRSSFFFTH